MHTREEQIGKTRDVIAWDEKWPLLRHGEVYPLPLATETKWAAEGWEVNVIALAEASDEGYAHTTVWSHREPYDESAGATAEDAQRVTQAAIHTFALRLHEVLSG